MSLFGRFIILFAGFSALSASAVEVIYTKTTYDEHGKFRTAIESRTSKGANGFTGNQTKRIDLGNFCSATLVEADQAFSLSRMLEIGYITEEEYHFYTNLSAGLEPEQVIFFHQSRRIKLSEALTLPLDDQKKFERLIESRFSAVFEIDGTGIDPFAPGGAELLNARGREAIRNPTIQMKDASLYVVRGQGWDPYLKRRFFKLPWMKEAKFAHAAEFSRIDVPLTFEIGRAAQIDEGKFSELLKLAVLEMAEEARTFGVDPAKVMVFGHARDKVHRILYERSYGLKPFPEGAAVTEDCVMAGTLADLLKRYPEAKTLEVLHEIEVASNGILAGEKAAVAFAKFRDELFQALDATTDSNYPRKPVFLMNDLHEFGGLLAERLVPMGIPIPHSDPEVGFVNRVLTAFMRPFSGRFGLTDSMIADPIMKLQPMNASRKALRIYNLDGAGLEEDGDYVLRTLFGVRELYRKRVEEFYQVFRNGTVIPDPLYAIVTTDQKIRDAAIALGGKVETAKVPGESFVAFNGVKAGDRLSADVPMGDYYTIYLDDSQVRALISKHEDLNRRSLSLFKRGKWQEKLRLNSGATHF
jgi:hypothetical protein